MNTDNEIFDDFDYSKFVDYSDASHFGGVAPNFENSESICDSPNFNLCPAYPSTSVHESNDDNHPSSTGITQEFTGVFESQEELVFSGYMMNRNQKPEETPCCNEVVKYVVKEVKDSSAFESLSTKYSSTSSESGQDVLIGWENTPEPLIYTMMTSEESVGVENFHFEQSQSNVEPVIETITKKICKTKYSKVSKLEAKGDIQNAAGLIAQRVRTGCRAIFNGRPGQNLGYIRRIFEEENLNEDEMREVQEFLENFGNGHRTYRTVMQAIESCQTKKGQRAFCRCIEAFLTTEGQEDYLSYVGQNRGSGVKASIIAKKNTILNNYQSKFQALGF